MSFTKTVSKGVMTAALGLSLVGEEHLLTLAILLIHRTHLLRVH